MFSKRTRLPKEAFGAPGKRVSSTHFSAITPHGVKGYAVVVSKKVARLAVRRNRIKRRVRAALSALSLPPAFVVFPRASADHLSAKELRTELAVLVSKAVL